MLVRLKSKVPATQCRRHFLRAVNKAQSFFSIPYDVQYDLIQSLQFAIIALCKRKPMLIQLNSVEVNIRMTGRTACLLDLNQKSLQHNVAGTSFELLVTRSEEVELRYRFGLEVGYHRRFHRGRHVRRRYHPVHRRGHHDRSRQSLG